MRARGIKPGFFKNEILAEVNPVGRLLFIGLWCLADRDGRLEDRPKRIKAELFPYDVIQVEKLLDELADRNFIKRYTVAACKYIEIIKFKQHQHINIREQESTIPAPNKDDENTEQIPDKNALLPLTLVPHTLVPLTPTAKADVDGDFKAFWEAYPKKVGKLDAMKAWKKNGRPGIEKILEAIAKQRASPGWMKDGGQYIPNPSTWLNQGRWDDEIEPSEDVFDKLKRQWREEDGQQGPDRGPH